MKGMFIVLFCIIAPALLWAYPENVERFVPKPRDPFQRNNPIHYVKGRLFVDVKNMPLRSLLEQIAHYSNKNIIVSQNVKGNISVHIVKATCKQALDIVTKMYGLKQYRRDQTLLIMANNESIHDMDIDLQTDFVKLNHIQARVASDLVDNKNFGLLSKNGRMLVDVQTNTVLIKDVPQRLKDIRQYLRQIDLPTKQILIRVRVVSVNNNFTKELGLKFFSTPSKSSDAAGLNMDLPNMLSNPGRFGFTMARLNKNNLLDLELSALENEGHGKIISSPELITSNQHPAYIEAGDQIPYQEKTDHGGSTTVFKKAVLSLKVMPEIVPDNKVVLRLVINHDKVSPLLFNGVPAIQTHVLRTEVLADNGETIVLGGIYEEMASNNLEKTPLLSRVPLLRVFFSCKK